MRILTQLYYQTKPTWSNFGPLGEVGSDGLASWPSRPIGASMKSKARFVSKDRGHMYNKSKGKSLIQAFALQSTQKKWVKQVYSRVLHLGELLFLILQRWYVTWEGSMEAQYNGVLCELTSCQVHQYIPRPNKCRVSRQKRSSLRIELPIHAWPQD